jgi:hypothetical protein
VLFYWDELKCAQQTFFKKSQRIDEQLVSLCKNAALRNNKTVRNHS